MLNISRFTCESLTEDCITDEKNPVFSFSLQSDRRNVSLAEARLTVNDWSADAGDQIAVRYQGKELAPFTVYDAALTVTDDAGETAEKTMLFETGRMDTPWQGKWISDGTYHFTEKRVSPVPMTFKKEFKLEKRVTSAKVYATAMGIYELTLNGEKVGRDYFAPGFTSYNTHLQYQVYDITGQLGTENVLTATVSGGWAVGSFVFTRKNRITADRQALLLEIRLTFADGSSAVWGTDESFLVTREGNCQAADLYDGEVYDATIDSEKINWHPAAEESLRAAPKITAAYGVPVRAHEIMKPNTCTEHQGELIYDFGQNFAGIVRLKMNGRKGQKITVRHSEILNPDGSLNTKFLRTAKARVTYTCRAGRQIYSPSFTYMGFRYISITGIAGEDIEVEALALYSDMETIGTFSCSNPLLNQLQSNIIWSAKSNFVDIPTDCPQRDERMGWTGDIALFAPTAGFNMEMTRFLYKWLLDVKAEQLKTGGIPNTVPSQGYGFPATMPTLAIDFWGDACVLVPWTLYCSNGDEKILEEFYPVMKKYVDACRFWASFGIGKHRYIWHTPHMFHFGDWVAPDVKKMSQWQKRSPFTATASLKNTSDILARIAGLLGLEEEQRKYRQLSDKTAQAYREVFTDGKGKLKKEFQTGYVLPLYFDIFTGTEKEKAAANLVRLIKAGDYCIGTGFPGTPFILFALADNGYADVAYQMLLNTKCPSWLYQIKMGATTIWERWDGLDENGICPIGDDGTDLMISYNHYANGAVGDFMYRRILGIEALAPGYRQFQVKPVLGGGLTQAKGSIRTPYGVIAVDWQIKRDEFLLEVVIPVGTRCSVTLPTGESHSLSSGRYSFKTSIIK